MDISGFVALYTSRFEGFLLKLIAVTGRMPCWVSPNALKRFLKILRTLRVEKKCAEGCRISCGTGIAGMKH